VLRTLCRGWNLQGLSANPRRMMSRRPDFFIVGAPKAGTSSLYNYLSQHPNIFLSEPKEPHFFHNRRSPGSPVLGEKNLEDYLRLFEGVPDNMRAGEASSSYLYSANAAREIREVCPDAKIIMILRNPVDRAYSQYWNHVRDGNEHLSFEEALREEPERIKNRRWCGSYYMTGGRYAEQVARYLDVFGSDAVKVYLFEELKRDAPGVCRDAFSFLGVDSDVPINTREAYNRSGPPRSTLLSNLSYRLSKNEFLAKVLPVTLRRAAKEWLLKGNVRPVPMMDPNTRVRLQEAYRDNILRLGALIGRDLKHWMEQPARPTPPGSDTQCGSMRESPRGSAPSEE
jgi:Sulfotransferase domain